jgi:hypothetical protein
MSRDFNKNTAHVLETDVQKIQKYGSCAGDRCPEISTKIQLTCWRQMSRSYQRKEVEERCRGNLIIFLPEGTKCYSTVAFLTAVL